MSKSVETVTKPSKTKRMLEYGQVKKALEEAALSVCNSSVGGKPCWDCRMHTRDLVAEFLYAMGNNDSAIDLRQRLVCEACDA